MDLKYQTWCLFDNSFSNLASNNKSGKNKQMVSSDTMHQKLKTFWALLLFHMLM